MKLARLIVLLTAKQGSKQVSYPYPIPPYDGGWSDDYDDVARVNEAARKARRPKPYRDPYADLFDVAYGGQIRQFKADHERLMATNDVYAEAFRRAEADIEAGTFQTADPEEWRRANTVASDGERCMIYRRSS